MPYFVIALMLIGPWAQAAETMTAEDAANRFCEAYNLNQAPSAQAPYCKYEDPFFGQSSVDLYIYVKDGFTIGHGVEAFSDNLMCELLFEGFANYNPPIGQEITTLRNYGWVLRIYAAKNDVSRLANTCKL